MGLLDSLPAAWKRVIKNEGTDLYEHDYKETELDTAVFSLSKPSGVIYKLLVNEHTDQPCDRFDKWSRDMDMAVFDTDLDWYSHIQGLYQCTRSVVLKSFIYNFNMRNLATNKYLHMVKIADSPLCNKCNAATDSIYHMFWECIHAKNIWVTLNKWLSEVFHLKLITDSSAVLMHILVGNEDYLNILTFVYIICKRLIYINRESISPLTIAQVVNSLKKYEKIERTIALQKKKNQKHYNKWLDLYHLWLNDEI